MILDKIIENNINWLTNSDICIKQGKDKGALYGWKDLTNSSYPFIYSEIVGYAITCFSWLFNKKYDKDLLNAAQEGAQWIINNKLFGLLTTGKINTSSFDSKGDISNQIYSFDNGMILTGLMNLYKIDKDSKNLNTAIEVADGLIDKFFDGKKMIAMLDSSFNPSEYGKGKWSTMSGSYQAKIAMGLLKLFKVTQKSVYREVSHSICDFALTMQNQDGRFKTNIEDDLTFLHPHLYSCEGLLYSGINLSDSHYVEASLKGLEWAINLMENNKGTLPRSTKENIEQSDCMAQLMRLLIICYTELKKRDNYDLDSIIEKLRESISKLYVSDGESNGGFRYQSHLNQICTWCTMFSLQSFVFYKDFKEKDNLSMTDLMEYYI